MDNNNIQTTNKKAGNDIEQTHEQNHENNNSNYYIIIFFVMAIGASLFYSAKSTKNGFRTKTQRLARDTQENTAISNSKYVFGIDISHYQGKINWDNVKTSSHPITFVFIRASMGKNKKDNRFSENWENAQKHNYVRGAYHYYRPSENSTKQFDNYNSIVKLKSVDFILILDIEKESVFGRKNLRKGVLNWLKLAEAAYGVKPMIYTGLSFYNHTLKGYVDDYPIWIAAYSGKHRVKNTDWTFHQFTEKVIINGIGEYVDGNDFNGTLDDLKKMCIN